MAPPSPIKPPLFPGQRPTVEPRDPRHMNDPSGAPDPGDPDDPDEPEDPPPDPDEIPIRPLPGEIAPLEISAGTVSAFSGLVQALGRSGL